MGKEEVRAYGDSPKLGVWDEIRAQWDKGIRSVATYKIGNMVLGVMSGIPSREDKGLEAILRLIEKRDTSQDILRGLSEHPGLEVRVGVARHANTPQEVLSVMAFDPEPGVRSAVIGTTTSLNVLKLLMVDPDDTVRMKARMGNSRIGKSKQEGALVSGASSEALEAFRMSFASDVQAPLSYSVRERLRGVLGKQRTGNMSEEDDSGSDGLGDAPAFRKLKE